MRNVLLWSLAAIGLFLLSCGDDTESPKVTMVSPRNGDTLPKGKIGVKVLATDDVRVDHVEFSIDDSVAGNVTARKADTFSYEWDASGVPNLARRVIKARAYDKPGNSAYQSASVVLVGAGPTYHSGAIVRDEEWKVGGNPHVISDTLLVKNSATLRIDPGCVVYFERSATLVCGDLQPGTIVAEGTPTQPIRFSSRASPPAPGDWGSIALCGQATATTSFSRCTLEYGGRGNSGIFFVEAPGARIKDCVVRHSPGYGILCRSEGGFGECSGNTVTDCGLFPVKIDCRRVGTLRAGNDFTGNARDDVEIEGGVVDSSALWPDIGVPYYVNSTVQVGDDDNEPVLVLAPGVVLLFAAGSGFDIGFSPGGLVADGSSGRIVLTSAAQPAQRGDWVGVSFRSQALAGSCRLVDCRIEYGGQDSTGCILIQNAWPEIAADSIEHSSTFGIYLDGVTHPPKESLVSPHNWFYDNPSGEVGP
jgi:hypothetical protein